jgi:dolichol-phosphate mannosyltransferase
MTMQPPGAAPRLEVPDLSIVIPLYNEEENVQKLYRRLTSALKLMGLGYEIVFVNDGSKDRTAELLRGLHESDPHVVAVHLSRNFGHQAAVCAGIDQAAGKAVLLMDGDLQDPPEVLHLFVDLWRQGYEVVYAIRQKRKEGLFKRLAYFTFYRLLRAISDLEIPLDSGDFCLMDRKVVEALQGLPEKIRFVRGLRTFVGFRQVGLSYERAAREAGQPKYTLRKLIGLALDGLVSFSSYPLHLVTYLGLAAAALAALLTAGVFADALCNGSAPRGWASTIVVVLFMSAIQLVSLGIMGEYVRRIFLECKGRPTYIVREVAQRSPRALHKNGHEGAPQEWAPCESNGDLTPQISLRE